MIYIYFSYLFFFIYTVGDIAQAGIDHRTLFRLAKEHLKAVNRSVIREMSESKFRHGTRFSATIPRSDKCHDFHDDITNCDNTKDYFDSFKISPSICTLISEMV